MSTRNISPISCANCGFMYAISRDGNTFNPDLIRKLSYNQSNDASAIHITSTPEITSSDGSKHPVTWFGTNRILCFHTRYTQSIVSRRPDQFTENWEEIAELIDHDRSDKNEDDWFCNDFFQYHPGYTPQQHVQLQLDEKRAAILMKHQEQLTVATNNLTRRYEDAQLTLSQNILENQRKWSAREWVLSIGITIIAFVNLILAYLTYLYKGS